MCAPSRPAREGVSVSMWQQAAEDEVDMDSDVSGVFACITPIRDGDSPLPRRPYPAARTTLRAALRSAYSRALQLCKTLKSRWIGRRRGHVDMPAIVRSVLAYQARRDSNEVRASENLYRDLGLTSLGFAMAARDLEDILGFQLDPDVLRSMHTVADLVCATENGIGPLHPFLLARSPARTPRESVPERAGSDVTSPVREGSASQK